MSFNVDLWAFFRPNVRFILLPAFCERNICLSFHVSPSPLEILSTLHRLSFFLMDISFLLSLSKTIFVISVWCTSASHFSVTFHYYTIYKYIFFFFECHFLLDFGVHMRNSHTLTCLSWCFIPILCSYN